jgi:hypothetical protein
MAVVRCPRHGIPYNDENPRGCPACAQEREGQAEEARLMRDLARASRGDTTVEVLPPEPEEEEDVYQPWPPPVTLQPRVPTAAPGRLERAGRFLRDNWMGTVAIVLVIGGIGLLWSATRPTFTEQYVPPLIATEPRPFPVEPNTPMAGVFSLLGTRSPQINPDEPSLARYDYGSGAIVDALNGVVYAVTLETPEQTWHGHRVGSGEQPARGALALEGLARDEPPAPAAVYPFAGFLTYRSMEVVPRRRLTAEVRPPNGCYDVLVDIRPQVIGSASRRDNTFVAVARRGRPIVWVVHRIQAVNRAVDGPYGTAAC